MTGSHRSTPGLKLMLFAVLVAIQAPFILAQTPMRLAIPSYMAPGTLAWNAWAAPGPAAVGLMIVNQNNGDDISVHPGFAEAIAKARAAGILVLSYTYTDYGKRDPAQVRAKIDAAYKNYPLDGIFFDQTPTDCGGANAYAPTHLSYYEQLSAHVRKRGNGRRLVVFNPGTPPPDDCWMAITDILLNFENSGLAKYRDEFADHSWTDKYPPERFWHLIYNVASVEEMRIAFELARRRGAGWIYVTSDGGENPWDTVPSYWAEEVHAITGKEWQGADPTPGGNPSRLAMRWRGSNKLKWQIFIDADQKDSTGYGAGIAIGADFLVEIPGNGSVTLLRYAGTGTDWKWTPVAANTTLRFPAKDINLVEFDRAPLADFPTVKVQLRSLDHAWTPLSTSGPIKWNTRTVPPG